MYSSSFIDYCSAFYIGINSKETSISVCYDWFAAFLLGQIIFNLLVVTGIVRNPPSGVFVPFVSYGGSQLVVQLVAIGALLAFCNIEKIALEDK